MAIPNMPARIPGATREFHPLAVAIAHAVVGPPILAFEANRAIFLSKFSTFPTPSITARCIDTWIQANAKILGAVSMTLHMLPLAPTTAKKTCY